MSVAKVGLATVVFAGFIASSTVGGVISAWSDGYFLGRAKKKGVTYKNIARRNAALGGVIGAIAAAVIIASPEKEAEKAKSDQLYGIGNPPNVY